MHRRTKRKGQLPVEPWACDVLPQAELIWCRSREQGPRGAAVQWAEQPGGGFRDALGRRDDVLWFDALCVAQVCMLQKQTVTPWKS